MSETSGPTPAPILRNKTGAGDERTPRGGPVERAQRGRVPTAQHRERQALRSAPAGEVINLEQRCLQGVRAGWFIVANLCQCCRIHAERAPSRPALARLERHQSLQGFARQGFVGRF